MSTANNKPTDESVSLNAFKQPKAFYLIFSIELWERFGYYGLQGIMAVYPLNSWVCLKPIPSRYSLPSAPGVWPRRYRRLVRR